MRCVYLFLVALLFCNVCTAIAPFSTKRLTLQQRVSQTGRLKVFQNTSSNFIMTEKNPPTVQVPLGAPTSALIKRVATSLLLTMIGTPILFAGKPLFSAALVLPLLQGIREFHFLLKHTSGLSSVGLPVEVVSAMLTCFVACYYPRAHPFMLPMSVAALLLQVLLFTKDITPSGDIAASMFAFTYIGYFVSFWIRLLDVASVKFTSLPMLKWGPITLSDSSFLLWWTISIIASADIGGFVFGKSFGSRAHKLSSWGAAGGKASPGKTLEGVIGGVILAIISTLIGVFYLHPVISLSADHISPHLLWFMSPTTSGHITIALGTRFAIFYGTLLALLSVVSDISISIFKRNAGVKDSGQILPGHGGVLDRMDSYILTAPVVYLFWFTLDMAS